MSYHSYAEGLLASLKNKKIEIYTGDTSRVQEYSDYSLSQKSVIRGVLRDCLGDCVVVECTDSRGATNLVYLNGWSITAVMEPKNNLSIVDIFINESEKQEK